MKWLLLGVCAVLLLPSACAITAETREGLYAYADVIELEGEFIVAAVDPVAYGTRSGTWSKDDCIWAAKMIDVARQGNPLMASSLRELADGRDIVIPERELVDYEAQCPGPGEIEVTTDER